MKSTEELLKGILNLGEGWEIKDIKIDSKTKEIDIYVEYTKTTAYFPKSIEQCKIYDFSNTRRIRHLDIFDYKAFINARIPRVIAERRPNEALDVRVIELSWADERVSYSFLFEYKIIEALQLSKNQTKTAAYFDVSFDIVHGIMQRAVQRGLARRDLDGIRHLSLDEKSFGNGQKYLSVLSDPINKCVLDIIEGRKAEDTEELLVTTMTSKQLENIWTVSMDMWKAYMTTVEEILPQADIVHDKFHTAKYLNKAVDEVRKQEVKHEEILKKGKYLFLKNKENWTESQMLKFEEVNRINLKTSQAWQMKENFKGIYSQGGKQVCMNYFEDWYKNTLESGILQMINVADTLLNHLNGIINAAVHNMTNSIAENLNSQIQVVKSVARGFANFEGYRNAILFFQGKLEMSPL
jgi:transposase